MQKIKLIISDIDGTLISESGENISDENMQAIEEARAMGVGFTIATGRILSTAMQYVRKLKIELPVISCCGADIRDERQSYYMDNMSEDTVCELVQEYSGSGIRRYIFSDNKIYCTKDDYWKNLFDKWERGNGKYPIIQFENEKMLLDAIRKNTQKVLLWSENDEQRQNMIKICTQFEQSCEVVRGEAYNMEFTKKGVSKGSAVTQMAKILGIKTDEIMALGDGGNDVDMLRAAGLGVAMKNSMPEALAAADYVTESCQNNGVAAAIKKFVLDR
ncbi:MAG: Cof-type HAD-IIB family hydrolase [Christensenellaceae bacterium]